MMHGFNYGMEPQKFIDLYKQRPQETITKNRG